jgi:hypothetical protein
VLPRGAVFISIFAGEDGAPDQRAEDWKKKATRHEKALERASL